LRGLTNPGPEAATRLDAAILAGGHGHRLGGRDKSAIVIDGVDVLDRQLAALAPVAARVFVVGRPAARFAERGLPVVEDLVAGAGPLGGVYTALRTATTSRVLVIACDMPFLTAEFLAFVGTVGHGCDVVVPRDGRGLHPLCAAWSVDAAPIVGRVLDEGVRAVRGALEALRVHIIEENALREFDPDGRLLHNINTLDDLARARILRG
jgi:molybdopterin-guanine dinucleotide biosynthesis protein A